MARRTKLNKDLVSRAQVYLLECVGDRNPLPTIEGLALSLGVHRDTVYAWEETATSVEKPSTILTQFSDIVKRLRTYQAEKLIQNGLSGRYNPTITKLILSGKHGYVEKQATEHSGAIELKPVEVMEVGEPGRTDP
jgi:hypothetical protein